MLTDNISIMEVQKDGLKQESVASALMIQTIASSLVVKPQDLKLRLIQNGDKLLFQTPDAAHAIWPTSGQSPINQPLMS